MKADIRVSPWNDLIGRHYATYLAPIHRALVKGILLLIAGFPVCLLTVAYLPGLTFSEKEIIAIAVYVLFLIPFILGVSRLVRLQLIIQKDLENTGLTVKPGGPDLRTTETFKSWSKRSGITPEDIIRVGNSVLGEKEKNQ